MIHTIHGKYVVALICIGLFAAQTFSEGSKSVPMKSGLVSVKIRVGVNDKEPSTWEGSYRVTEGKIIATDGWRFIRDDYATLANFKLEVRRWYRLFWNLRKGDPKKFPIEPNGFILTLDGVTSTSNLEVKTSRGDFSVPLRQLKYGQVQMRLKHEESKKPTVEVERVPTSRIIVAAPTEDAYPSAVAGPDGAVYVAYLAFTHGEKFRNRAGLKTEPKDLAYLAAPTGGDRVMFAELKGGQWTDPLPLTLPGGDLFRTAIAVDGAGQVWVFWSANVDGNWDIYACVREGENWSKPIRITSSPGSDINHVAATDSTGRIWLAWQGFRRNNSDIFVARQEGNDFGEPTRLAEGPANEWTPAIAASSDGKVAVVWDSYAAGDYDVFVRVWRGAEWGKQRVVAADRRNDLRPTLVFDKQNRLWIAYESAPELWGKDWGPYDKISNQSRLYAARRIGVKVIANERFYAPGSDVNMALPMPHGGRRWPKSPKNVLAAGPRLACDAQGRVWLAARIRMQKFVSSSVGTTWISFLTTLDDQGWRPAAIVTGTDGLLHESPSLVPAPDGGLYIVSASDGRFRTAPFFFGRKPWRNRQRSKNIPPATTRNYAQYPDWWANWEIAAADTGKLAPPGNPKLVEVPEDSPHELSPQAIQEAQQVAAIRSYRAELGGKRLRILRGEFHRHTEISSDGGGDGSIFDMWRYAIDMAALDWIGNGDHNNGGGRELCWWITQKTTDVFHVADTFTPMFTYERSRNYPDGHRNVVFAKRGVRVLATVPGSSGKAMDNLPPDAPRPHTPDTQLLYRYLKFFDGVCAAHTSGTNMGTDWRDNDPKVEPIVEIYQGCRQSYERPGAPRSNSADYSLGDYRPYGFVSLALLKGYRLGFQASSDHVSTHISYCNVYVEKPTREAILDAMKRRRIYGATDNIIADVRCGEHFMGEEFTTDKPPTLHVKLIGTASFARVYIVKDNEYVYSAEPKDQTVEFQWTDNNAKPGKTSYYYVRGEQVGKIAKRKVGAKKVEVELNNGEIVWVSPMWITYKP